MEILSFYCACCGSIVYGMWNAAQQKKVKSQIVIYTDADLSTHLGQLMLLVESLLTQNKLAAIGSRRERNSVVIKKGAPEMGRFSTASAAANDN